MDNPVRLPTETYLNSTDRQVKLPETDKFSRSIFNPNNLAIKLKTYTNIDFFDVGNPVSICYFTTVWMSKNIPKAFKINGKIFITILL